MTTSLEIDVEAKGGDKDGAAILVVAGVIDVLKVEGSKEAAPEMGGVKALEDLFVTVIQRAIAEKKSAPAEREIFLVGGDYAVQITRLAVRYRVRQLRSG